MKIASTFLLIVVNIVGLYADSSSDGVSVYQEDGIYDSSIHSDYSHGSSETILSHEEEPNDGRPLESIDSLGDEFLLVTDYGKQTILASNLHDIKFKTLPFPVLNGIWGVDYDPVRQLVCWSEYTSAIKCAHLDGSGLSVVASSDVECALGVAVDPEHSVVYWSEYYKKTIERAHYDGTNRHVIVEKKSGTPVPLVIDFSRRKLYWANHGAQIVVERVDMDRPFASPETFVTVSETSQIDGLALDYQDSRLYWYCEVTARVESVNIFGQDRQILVEGQLYSEGLFWHHSKLYLVERTELDIKVINETSGRTYDLGRGYFKHPIDLSIVSSRQDPSQWECLFDRFGFNLCGWAQSFTDNCDWIRQKEFLSKRSDNENYIMVFNGTNREEGDTAVLISPFSKAHAQTISCLYFRYRIWGTTGNVRLTVQFGPKSSPPVQPLLWTTFGKTGSSWLGARVNVTGAGDGYFHMKGLVETPGSTFVGIDDVRFGECLNELDPDEVPAQWRANFNDSVEWIQSSMINSTWERESMNSSSDEDICDFYNCNITLSGKNRFVGDRVLLTSPYLEAIAPAFNCLTFRYSILESTGKLRLNVYFGAASGIPSPRLLWTMSENMGSSWLQAQINVTGAGHFIVEGLVERSGSSIIEVEELQVGSCEEESDPDEGNTSFSPNVNKSDEWTRLSEDNFDWEGDAKNYTFTAGFCGSHNCSMILNGTNRSVGDRATLISPFSKSFRHHHCLSFRYYILENTGNVRLNVYFNTSSGSPTPRLLWTKSGSTAPSWPEAQLNISGAEEGHFIIEGMIESHGSSLIRIEDIKLGSCDSQLFADKGTESSVSRRDQLLTVAMPSLIVLFVVIVIVSVLVCRRVYPNHCKSLT